MSAAYVQGVFLRGAGDGATGVLPSNVTAGNTIVILLPWSYNGCPPSFTDNLDNLYVAETPGALTPSGGQHFWVFTAPVTSAGACTVTLHSACGLSDYGAIVEVSGLASDPFDQINVFNNPASSTRNTGSITPSANGAYIAAIFTQSEAGGTPTYTPDTGYTERDDASGYCFIDTVQTTAAAINPQVTSTTSNAGVDGFVVSFKATVVATGLSSLGLFDEELNRLPRFALELVPKGRFDADLVPPNEYVLSAAYGSFAFTGNATALKVGKKLTAAQGGFTETGQPVNVLFGRKVAVSQGSFVETGNATNLLATRRLTADQGSFVETGQAVSLNITRLPLVAANGAFVLTGENTNLYFGRTVRPSVGVFTLTGEPASLLTGKRISANAGSFTLAGQSVSLISNHLIALTRGLFSETGFSVNLTQSASPTLVVSSGSFTLTGQATGLRVDRRLSLAQGAFALTGQDLSLAFSRRLQGVNGSYALSGTVSLLNNHLLNAISNAFTLGGSQVFMRGTHQLAAGTGQFNLLGYSVFLSGGTPIFSPTSVSILYTNLQSVDLLSNQLSVSVTDNRQNVSLADNRQSTTTDPNRLDVEVM